MKYIGKYIGRIVVGLVVLAVIFGACYQCLRMANEKADEKIKSKAAELVIDYADLAYAYRKADAEFAAQLKGVADTNAKLAKDMAEGLLSMKTAVVNSNSALEAVSKTDKEVVSIKQRLAVVEDKLSKPAVVDKTKPEVKKPAVVAKKPVKKAIKKPCKKPAKVVKPCKGTKVTVTNGATTVDVYVNIITKKPVAKK